jgi:hypothetical protein
VSPQQGEIKTLIVLDRKVDILTPLLIQNNYLGTIDEFFGINKGSWKLPKDLVVKNDPKAWNLAVKSDPNSWPFDPNSLLMCLNYKFDLPDEYQDHLWKNVLDLSVSDAFKETQKSMEADQKQFEWIKNNEPSNFQGQSRIINSHRVATVHITVFADFLKLLREKGQHTWMKDWQIQH